MSSSPGTIPNRSETELQQWQREGQLQVRSATAFRALAQEQGLEQAYRETHVVVASDAELTQQASLVLHLGPSDPPIRVRQVRFGPAEGHGGHGNTDLVIPMGSGGAPLLSALLEGQRLPLSIGGTPSQQQPKVELETELGLAEIPCGRLLLHRGICENGVVAVSSREGLTPTPWGPVLGPWTSALYSCRGPGSIGLSMPGLQDLGAGSPVLVGGAIGWVSGPGSGHNPATKRSPSGHALGPGACCALQVDLHGLKPSAIRSTRLPDGSSGLLVAIAAPIPLLNRSRAEQLLVPAEALSAPLLDFGIPRRVRPSPASATYAELLSGRVRLGERQLSAAPAHSPRLAEEAAAQLEQMLQSGAFPLRLPLAPLPSDRTVRALN